MTNNMLALPHLLSAPTFSRYMFWLAGLLLTLVTTFPLQANSVKTEGLQWSEFNQNSFQRASNEQKYILLDLVAVWCHWCHVMDEKTYTDPKVLAIIDKHFIPVKADHDLRPDLAERYREWGWPATIILHADGTEIVKRAGYINAENMVNLLNAIVKDPSPEGTTLSLPKQLSTSPIVSNKTLKQLKKSHQDSYDNKLGGLNINQKFLDADSVEWDLWLSSQGDQQATKRITQTLQAAAKLVDPAFGGAYQYSTYGDWEHPHYEKIMLTQYKYLHTYSKACQQLKQPSYCTVAKQVADYMVEFLKSPKTEAFYTSQDADLIQGKKSHGYFQLNREQRLAQGIPRVDKHHYASHNGRAIEGFLALYQATQEKKYLKHALKAMNWIIKNRRYYGGGYRHDKLDAAGPYLADTLYMGRAFLKVYEINKDERYLQLASQAANFIDNQFKHDTGGLVSATDNGTPARPLPQLDQNIHAARFLARLHNYSNNSQHLALLEHTMKLLATHDIATSRLTEAGILLAAKEYAQTLNPNTSSNSH